jgi:hypothetical protein
LQLGRPARDATAAKAAPLSAADGQRLLDLVKRQQRQIERLREQVKEQVAGS